MAFRAVAKKVGIEEQLTSKTIKKLEGNARLRDASLAQQKLKLDELQKVSLLVLVVAGLTDLLNHAVRDALFCLYEMLILLCDMCLFLIQSKLYNII